MESISKLSFSINLRLMTVLRMYNPHKSSISFNVEAFVVFTLLIPPVPILGALFFILGEVFTAAQLNDNAFVIAQLACQVIKFFPFVVNGAQIKKCIHYFDTTLFGVHRENQKQMLGECCRICRRNSTIFLTLICIGMVFLACRPVFNSEQRFPTELWLPYNLTSEPKLFYFIYSYIVIGVGYTALACAAIDPLLAGLPLLAAGQLQILKDNLQHIGEYVEEFIQKSNDCNLENRGKRKIVRDLIRHCVNHHNAVLDFISDYEQCFSLSLFSQLMDAILVICFCCLQLSKLEPISFNFFSMFIFLCAALAQIYIYCYYGTILFEETNTLTAAIYTSYWYDYDIETKRDLFILMERSKKPVMVTAGKILELSIDTFSTILKRSYSLLAVLKTM